MSNDILNTSILWYFQSVRYFPYSSEVSVIVLAMSAVPDLPRCDTFVNTCMPISAVVIMVSLFAVQYIILIFRCDSKSDQADVTMISVYSPHYFYYS